MKTQQKKNNFTATRPEAWLSVAGILFLLFLSVVAFSLIIDFFVPEPGFMGMTDIHRALEFRETLLFAQLVISTLNSVLLIYLLLNYVSIYLELKSKFSLGLVAMASALLAYSISANPIIPQLFGFRGSGLGPFTIIPSLFTLVAVSALIYLSRQ